MKFKFKNLFLSFILVVAAFCVVGCKDKKDNDPAASDPTVKVAVEDREFYANDTLADIEIFLEEGSTSGTIAWVNPSQKLVIGENACDWVFTPKNSKIHNSKTDVIKIYASAEKETPIVHVSKKSEKAFVGYKLETVEIQTLSDDTAGKLEWVKPETVITEGAVNYRWKFTPNDTLNFKTIVGNLELNGVRERAVTAEISTYPTKTEYKALEQADTTGLILKAVCDSGRKVTVSGGFEVVYNNGDALSGVDTSYIVKYQEAEVVVPVTVNKIPLQDPTIIGTYTYNGQPQKPTFKQLYYSFAYEVEGEGITNAGTHKIPVKLKQPDNFVWRNSTTDILELDFVIGAIDLSVSENSYAGVYDGVAHSASVTGSDVQSVYYSMEELNADNYLQKGTTELKEFTNVGSYQVYYYAKGNANFVDVLGSVSVNIVKAEQNASVKYAFAYASSMQAAIPANYVTSLGVNQAELDLTDKLQFVYYTNYATKTLTSAANGSIAEGSAPKAAGTYTVETTILGSDNYNDAVVTSTLYIAERNNFMLAADGAQSFGWVSDDGLMYCEVYERVTNGLNGLVINIDCQIPNNVLVAECPVIYKDGKWQIEISQVQKTFDVSYNETDQMVTISLEDAVFAELNKFMIPTYLGRFEKDTISSDTTTPNSSLVIYNDRGVIKFTHTMYMSAGSEPVVRSGIVEFNSAFSRLNFKITTGASVSMHATAIIDISNAINVIDLIYSHPNISGEYARVN